MGTLLVEQQKLEEMLKQHELVAQLDLQTTMCLVQNYRLVLDSKKEQQLIPRSALCWCAVLLYTTVAPRELCLTYVRRSQNRMDRFTQRYTLYGFELNVNDGFGRDGLKK